MFRKLFNNPIVSRIGKTTLNHKGKTLVVVGGLSGYYFLRQHHHANLEKVRNEIISIWKPLVYRELNRGEQGASDFSVKRAY